MDPQFDERDAGAGGPAEPEPEREPEPSAREASAPAADDGPWAAPAPRLEPEPASERPARPELETEAEAEPGLEAADPQAETVMRETAAESESAAEAGFEPEERGSIPHRMRMGFRRWRHSRPFWGALLVNLGALEILYSMKAPLKVIVHFGPLGIAGYLLPLIMLLCGLLLWFNPAQRTFYSILSVLLALGTWITSNLGGFIIGLLLGLVGGSLAFGWRPFTDEEAEEREAKRDRKKALRARRKAARSGRVARTARARRVEQAGGGDPEIGKPTEA